MVSRQCIGKFPKGIMIVEGFCYNEKLKIKIVSSKNKINSFHYQQIMLEFLKTKLQTYVEKHLVEIHREKASSHTSKSTATCLAKKESET